MRLRSDALLAAARMIQSIAAIAAAAGPEAVGTVGLLECQPNSRNVVPVMVFLTVDLRHPRDDVVDAMMAAMHEALLRDADGLSLEVEQVWNNPAVEFHPVCVQAVRSVAERRGFAAREPQRGRVHNKGRRYSRCDRSAGCGPGSGPRASERASPNRAHNRPEGARFLSQTARVRSGTFSRRSGVLIISCRQSPNVHHDRVHRCVERSVHDRSVT